MIHSSIIIFIGVLSSIVATSLGFSIKSIEYWVVSIFIIVTLNKIYAAYRGKIF